MNFLRRIGPPTIQKRPVKNNPQHFKNNCDIEKSNSKKVRIESSVLGLLMIEEEENTTSSTKDKNRSTINIMTLRE